MIKWAVVAASLMSACVSAASADYGSSDQYMARSGFRVMPDPADPSRAAAFGRVPRVYVKGSGPRVIVLHELPGLRDGDIELGAALGDPSKGGFEVFMPLMFGDAGQNDTGLGKKQACKSGLFKCNERNTRHPIAADLVSMANQICAGADCGVIGMCLTGSFPLYLTEAKEVAALVIAQPTLPFYWHISPFAGLDISEADTTAAVSRAVERKASIYMVRYRQDWISGHSAFRRLVKRIEPSKEKLSFFEVKELVGNGHSTLVHDPHHAHVAPEQFSAVVKALNARLG